MRYIISGKNLDITEGLRCSSDGEAGKAGTVFYS